MTGLKTFPARILGLRLSGVTMAGIALAVVAVAGWDAEDYRQRRLGLTFCF